MAAERFELEGDEDQVDPQNVCSQCGRVCEPLERDTCPICRNIFCVYCAYRMTGHAYCSRRCADVIFFGDDDDAKESED